MVNPSAIASRNADPASGRFQGQEDPDLCLAVPEPSFDRLGATPVAMSWVTCCRRCSRAPSTAPLPRPRYSLPSTIRTRRNTRPRPVSRRSSPSLKSPRSGTTRCRPTCSRSSTRPPRRKRWRSIRKRPTSPRIPQGLDRTGGELISSAARRAGAISQIAGKRRPGRVQDQAGAQRPPIRSCRGGGSEPNSSAPEIFRGLFGRGSPSQTGIPRPLFSELLYLDGSAWGSSPPPRRGRVGFPTGRTI